MVYQVLFLSWQEALHPDRKAFWAVSALCSWMASLWTWRRELRSRLESYLDAQATAAAMARCARTRVAVRKKPTVSPATVDSRPTLEPSATKVQTLTLTVETFCRWLHRSIDSIHWCSLYRLFIKDWCSFLANLMANLPSFIIFIFMYACEKMALWITWFMSSVNTALLYCLNTFFQVL